MSILILTLEEACEHLCSRSDLVSEQCAKMFSEHMDGPEVKTIPYLIATCEQTIVGALWVHRAQPDTLPFPEVFYIDVVIAEAFQRRGVGRRLGEAALSRLRDDKVPVVIFPDSTGGKALAKSLGFVPHDLDLGEDEQEWVLSSAR